MGLSNSGRVCGSVDCLKLDGSELAEASLTAFAVIGLLDPCHDREPLLLAGRPPVAVEDVLLHECEERLHRGVITARPDPPHGTS